MKSRNLIMGLILIIFSISFFSLKKSGEKDELKHQPSEDVFQFICDQYSEICDALNSEPIKNLPKGKNAVRLISISSSPCYIIKLVWTKHKRTIDFIEGDVDGTKVVRKKSLGVSKESVNELLALIEEKDFYNQPEYLNISVRDGEEWFVEVNIDGKYKAVVRPCLEHTFLYDIGRKLLRLAGEGMTDEEEEAARKELEEYRKSIKLPIKKR